MAVLPAVLDRAAVAEKLPYDRLIDSLRQHFSEAAIVPPRQTLPFGDPSAPNGQLLLMSAWQGDSIAALKVATVIPDNAARGLPTIQALVLVIDVRTGSVVAVAEGSEITRRRTAAASALAASYLALPDARTLVVVGTGPQALALASAHRVVRPSIDEIVIWGRSQEKAKGMAVELSESVHVCSIGVTDDLERAVRRADIVSCATSSATPLVKGAWLREGSHLDLVGSFSADRRETDTDAVVQASVFVDTFEGCESEAGDILIPIGEGRINKTFIRGDLASLVSGVLGGRQSTKERTLFKSVGTALEDLAASRLLVER